MLALFYLIECRTALTIAFFCFFLISSKCFGFTGRAMLLDLRAHVSQMGLNSAYVMSPEEKIIFCEPSHVRWNSETIEWIYPKAQSQIKIRSPFTAVFLAFRVVYFHFVLYSFDTIVRWLAGSVIVCGVALGDTNQQRNACSAPWLHYTRSRKCTLVALHASSSPAGSSTSVTSKLNRSLFIRFQIWKIASAWCE